MVLPALSKGGYKVLKQQIIGKRPGGRLHKVDLIAIDPDNRKIIISMKWQQVSGTAEQKVPFEIISLIDAVKTGNYLKAYLVLGGVSVFDKWWSSSGINCSTGEENGLRSGSPFFVGVVSRSGRGRRWPCGWWTLRPFGAFHWQPRGERWYTGG
jgi:hypothetical protein